MAQTISTVTPVYNGSKYLAGLIDALSVLRDDLKSADAALELGESIFVVDDAIDDSETLLRSISATKDWVKVVTLSRNYGQHPATIAGMLHSSGDWIITLDEDLQHHPKYILSMLEKAAKSEADVCYANSADRVHNSFVKDNLARLFKSIMARILNNPHTQKFNSFRAIRGDIARGASSICRHETYLDIALSWFTKRIVTQNVLLIDDRNLNSEESGYSFMGLVRHAKRMVMSSKIKFLRLAIPFGIVAFLTSIVLSIYALASAALNYEAVVHKGWASTILVVLLLGGITILLVSILLESIGDLMLSSNGKPTFFVVDRSKDAELKLALSKLDYESIDSE